MGEDQRAVRVLFEGLPFFRGVVVVVRVGGSDAGSSVSILSSFRRRDLSMGLGVMSVDFLVLLELNDIVVEFDDVIVDDDVDGDRTKRRAGYSL